MWDREATRYSIKLLSKKGGSFVYRNKTDINPNGFIMPRDMIIIKKNRIGSVCVCAIDGGCNIKKE